MIFLFTFAVYLVSLISNNMNDFIIKAVEDKYGFNPLHASTEELQQVEEIIASDVTKFTESQEWDFSAFPNLRKIDCSFNAISKINVSNNLLLEEFRWEGVRGTLETIDLSKNTKLKRIIGGQDGLVELDFSHNTELESISIWLNRYLRWINLDNCTNLKSIELVGANIPFVDLTNCISLEYVDINYLNLYARKCGEYGPGYPRPIIFVNQNFDENIIPIKTRKDKSYYYYLVKTSVDSAEEKILFELKKNKKSILNIYADRYGECVADEHYRILSKIEECHEVKQSHQKSLFEDDDLHF